MSESENTEVQLEINDAKVHQLQINVDEQQSEILQLRKKNFELEGELIKLELEFK